MENQYRQEKNIFNGQFKLITEDNEFKMSLWVRGFGINDARGNEVLAMMGAFDLDNFEETENTLKVSFKIYPNGAKQYEVEINPFDKTFTYNNKILDLVYFANTFNE